MVPESISTETWHNLICTEESLDAQSQSVLNLKKLYLLEAEMGLVVRDEGCGLCYKGTMM